jgi:hypothetical protein
MNDNFVKSRKASFSVIPADPGSVIPDLIRDREESRLFKWLKLVWAPVFTGVTTFYKTINIQSKNLTFKI